MKTSIKFLDQPVPEMLPEFLDLFEGCVENDPITCIYTHLTKFKPGEYKDLKYVVCPCTGIAHLGLDIFPELKVIYLEDKTKLFDKVTSSPEWVIHAIFKMLKHNIRDSIELQGLKVGFVGYGRMMQRVSMMLQGFEVDRYYFDIKDPEFYINSEVKRIENLDEILGICDIIAIGLPENEATKNFIAKRQFECMRINRPYFINNSRNSIVNGVDLLSAFNKDELRGIALDVIEDYGSYVKVELLKLNAGLSNCYITPHIAGKGRKSRLATDRIVLEDLKKELLNG